MKLCPTCNRDYSDDSLSFCLDDGTPLNAVGTSASGAYDPQATLVLGTGRPTDPTPASPGTAGYGQAPSGGWPSQQTVAAKPRKSKAIWWVLGIGVLAIGGIVLAIVLLGVIGIATYSGSGTANRGTAPNNNNRKQPIDSVTDDGRKLAYTDDFSEQKWLVNGGAIGTAKYFAGMYQLEGVPDKYFVSVGPSDDYLTDANTTVKVTARSVSGTSSKYGYGIAVHTVITDGQANDYAFLIYTGDDPKFAVKMHQNGIATDVTEFTRSSLIRTGTTPNLLEVKVTRDQMTFYINGQYAISVPNSAGFTGGRVGLCLHDTYPVAFDDLEIYRQG